MTEKTRSEILNCLNQQWGNYVGRLQGYSNEELSAFLKKQGYKRLQDLLAHMIAWWQAGILKIYSFQSNPDYDPPSVDVDAFNAAAVADVINQPEAAVINTFETTRLQLVDLIQSLSDADLQNPKIIRQIEMEVLGHYKEHQIE